MKEIKINSAGEVIYNFVTPSKLPVYMWVNKDKNNVHMSLVVKYGSSGINFSCANVKYQVPTGSAHFLEHIKFYMKNADATELFYNLGCSSNAYTSLNETAFEVYANQNVPEALKLLLNFVYDNYFTKKIVENEKSIIVEEANTDKDDPEYEYYLKSNQSFLPKSNHRIPVIGYEKDINEISIDDISLIHNFFYRPENMFLVITGNFDKDELEKVIIENENNRVFKDIGKIKIDVPKESKEMLEKEIVIYSDKSSIAKGKYFIKTLLSDFKGYKKNEVLVALRTLMNVNFGFSSDFYEDVILSGTATKLYYSVTFDDNVIGIVFSITSEDPYKVFNLIEKKLKDLKITKEDINRVIKNNRTNAIMRFDNIYAVTSYIIAAIIDNDKLDDSKFEILNELTPKKILDIYKCVDQKNVMKSILKPKQKKETK